MNRRTLAILILSAWIGALAWLAGREIFRRGHPVVAGRQVVSPGAAYYRTHLGAELVGYSLLQVDTLAPTDTSPSLVLLQNRLLLAAGNAPGQVRFEINTAAWLTTDLKLWRSETSRGDPSGVVKWNTRVDGDTLTTTFLQGESTWVTRLILDTIPVPVEAVPLWIATYALPRVGRTASVAAIDLSTLARRRETWTATAESTFTVPDSVTRVSGDSFRIASFDTVLAWRLSSTDRSVQVHQWVDERGFPIRWWTGGGLSYDREAFEPVLVAFRRLSDSLTGRSRLTALAPLDLADARDTRRRDLALLLPGGEYPPLEASGPTQRIAGDTVETFEPNSWRGMQAMRPLAPLPITDTRFAQELLPEPLHSPGDTVLTAKALELRGTNPNAREVASRLHDFIYRDITTLAPTAGPSLRPAGVVLATGRGTPEEKASLLVALARRVGLPARIVGGIVLSGRGPRAHTWVEVFIGDWVPTDPTEQGLVATPSHVRLVTGASGRWTDLFPLAAALVATGRAPTEIR